MEIKERKRFLYIVTGISYYY